MTLFSVTIIRTVSINPNSNFKIKIQKTKALSKANEAVSQAATTRLAIQEKVIKISKQLSTAQSVKPVKGESQSLRESNGRYYATWTTPCPEFMEKHKLMPQKQDPERLYHDIR